MNGTNYKGRGGGWERHRREEVMRRGDGDKKRKGEKWRISSVGEGQRGAEGLCTQNILIDPPQ